MIKLKIHFTTVTGRRESNEDKHNIILNINNDDLNSNKINFFGIYDGHGGKNVSEYLENHISKFYMDKKVSYPFTEEYHCKVFEKIQQELMKQSYSYYSGSTCLINVMYRINNDIHMEIVNVGDSRLVIVDNISKQITVDHKPDNIDEKKRIEKMGGEIYKDSEGIYRIGDLSLSRAFGDCDNIPYITQKPDVYRLQILKTTKYIVMACDGLWDVIESSKIGKIIEQLHNKNENIAVSLAEYALQQNSTDNISIIVIEVL